jgi:hypothetical protein
MGRRTLVSLAAAGGLALSLVPAQAALADNAFDQVLKDYQSDGQIDPCAHSEKTLSAAQHQIPNDIQQYAPDFPDALSAALRQRAAGACDSGSGGSAGASGGSASSGGSAATGGSSAPAPAAPAPSSAGSSGKGSTPAPAAGASHAKAASAPTPPPAATPVGGELAASIPANAAASKAGVPLPIVLLAIVGGILLLVGLFVLLARFFGWDFERWQPALQTLREAGWQSQNTISDFADWVRRGR